MTIKAFNMILACLAAAAMTAVPATATAGAATGHAQAQQGFGIAETNRLDIVMRHPPGADPDDHLEFVLSDQEIPAGWTTMKTTNNSSATHFVYMIKLPEDQADLTREEYIELVSVPFQDAWDPYFSREVDVNEFFDVLVPSLPDWFFATVPSAGPGFVSGNQTSWTTMNLTPGTYIVECYVMDAEGTFHSFHGMVERLVVTEAVDETSAPEADHEVSISSTEGIVFENENVQPGMKTFEVSFEDNIVWGHGLGHDVQLIRLDDGTTVSDVNDWMDYLDVGAEGLYADRGALISSHEGDKLGPETFLGGVQDLFAEEYPVSAYFHANLKPGRYALVAEVPNPVQPDSENPEVSMLKTFSVTPWANLSGAWYDPATDGEGWNFVAVPDGLFGYFYSYDDRGEALWLVTKQARTDIERGEPVTYDLLQGIGGAFNNPVPPEELQQWGEVTLKFESCEEATAEISGADGNATQQLERLAPTAGLAGCGL
jgi:hypothetical protein